MLISTSDHGLNAAWQARVIAQNRLDQATTKAEIDAAIYELQAADIRVNEAIKKVKGEVGVGKTA